MREQILITRLTQDDREGLLLMASLVQHNLTQIIEGLRTGNDEKAIAQAVQFTMAARPMAMTLIDAGRTSWYGEIPETVEGAEA